MADLIVNDVALRYGATKSSRASRSPCRRARWSRCSAPRAAARPRCCARSPASSRRTAARSASATRSCSTPASAIDLPAEAARARPGVSVLRAVAAPHRVRQRRLRPQAAQGRAPTQIKTRVDEALAQIGLAHLGRALSAPALRRPAAARRAGARAGLRAARHPARRAAIEPRRQAARGGAGLAARSSSSRSTSPRCASPTTRSRRWRSPTASLLLNGGADRAAGYADGALHASRPAVRRRVHGQQQPARRHARSRATDKRAVIEVMGTRLVGIARYQRAPSARRRPA